MESALNFGPGLSAMFADSWALECNGEEARWVTRAKCGDEAAYRWLLQRYRVRAVRLAGHVLRRDSDAEDVAQVAFVQAFQRLSSLRDAGRFGPWFFRIVVRLCLDQKRRRQWQDAATDDPVLEVSGIQRTPDMDQKMVVEALLDRLTPPMRAALVLRELEGLDYEEIAVILQIPIGTVRSRLNSARAHFRTLWLVMESEDAN